MNEVTKGLCLKVVVQTMTMLVSRPEGISSSLFKLKDEARMNLVCQIARLQALGEVLFRCNWNEAAPPEKLQNTRGSLPICLSDRCRGMTARYVFDGFALVDDPQSVVRVKRVPTIDWGLNILHDAGIDAMRRYTDD
jgi:hypothetical protein